MSTLEVPPGKTEVRDLTAAEIKRAWIQFKPRWIKLGIWPQVWRARDALKKRWLLDPKRDWSESKCTRWAQSFVLEVMHPDTYEAGVSEGRLQKLLDHGGITRIEKKLPPITYTEPQGPKPGPEDMVPLEELGEEMFYNAVAWVFVHVDAAKACRSLAPMGAWPMLLWAREHAGAFYTTFVARALGRTIATKEKAAASREDRAGGEDELARLEDETYARVTQEDEDEKDE